MKGLSPGKPIRTASWHYRPHPPPTIQKNVMIFRSVQHDSWRGGVVGGGGRDDKVSSSLRMMKIIDMETAIGARLRPCTLPRAMYNYCMCKQYKT